MSNNGFFDDIEDIELPVSKNYVNYKKTKKVA